MNSKSRSYFIPKIISLAFYVISEIMSIYLRFSYLEQSIQLVLHSVVLFIFFLILPILEFLSLVWIINSLDNNLLTLSSDPQHRWNKSSILLLVLSMVFFLLALLAIYMLLTASDSQTLGSVLTQMNYMQKISSFLQASTSSLLLCRIAQQVGLISKNKGDFQDSRFL